MTTRVTWVAPDGGWGWVVVACSLLLHAQSFGILLSLGVMYVSWLEEFGNSRGDTSWVISTAVAVTFLLGPLPAAVGNRYGFRVVTILGGLMTSAGLILSYFATSVLYLVVTIGILAGSGCCFVFLSAVVVVSVYFRKRRPLAMGICTSGVGIGVFILGIIMDFLIDAYGWRGALLLTGAVNLHTCACGLLLRPLDQVEVVCDEEDPSRACGDSELYDRNSSIGSASGSCKKIDHYTKDKSLEILMVNENINIQNSKPNPTFLIEKFAKDVTASVNQSNGSLISHSLKFPTIHSNQLRAISLIGLKSNSLSSVHKPPVYSSLRNLDCTHSHSNQLLPFVPGMNNHQSLDIRSIKHPRSRSLLTYIPKNSDSKVDNTNDSDIIDISHQNHLTLEDSEKILSCFSSFTQSFRAVIFHNVEILKDPTFVQLVLSSIATNLAFVTPVMYLVDRAVESGLDKTSGAMLVSANGIGNIIGRLFFGIITYRWLEDSLSPYVAVLILAGVSTILSPLCGGSIGLHLVYSTLFGSFSGGYCTLVNLVVADVMGIEKATSSFGQLLTFMGIASLIGPPTAGLLFDWTSSYTIIFVITGMFFILGGLIFLPVAFGHWKRRRKNTKDWEPNDLKKELQGDKKEEEEEGEEEGEEEEEEKGDEEEELVGTKIP